MDGGDDDFSAFFEHDHALGAHRPLRLRLAPTPRLPAGALIPQTVFGRQAICGGIAYRVLCVSRAMPACPWPAWWRCRLRSIW